MRKVIMAARRLPGLLLRSRKCSLAQTIRPLSQEAEAANTRIYGAPKKQRLHAPLRPFGYPKCDTRYVSTVLESKQNLQHLAANLFAKPRPKPEPKPDIYIHHIDEDRYDYFTAYSLEEDGTLSRKYDIYPPAVVRERGFCEEESCNGLVHFLTRGGQEHLLWNPTTNEFKILPRPFEGPIPPGVSYLDMSNGIWFDNKSQDYKVITIVTTVERHEDDDDLGSRSHQILLYSLNSNSWKTIPCLEIGAFCMSHGVSINGFYYALAEIQGCTQVILSFDFSVETLSIIPLPDAKFEFRRLIVYNGMLGLFVFSAYKFKRTYEVWVMKDGTWSREAVFDTSGVDGLVWFTRNGELLYMRSYNDELLVYDRATGELKPLGIYGLGSGSIHFVPLFESYAQLKGVSDVEDYDLDHEKEEDGDMKPSLI